MSETKTQISLYHANWCGHCQRFKPTWEQLKNQLGDKVVFNEYEDGSNKAEIQRANIKGFPTIKITKNGNTYDYNGERTIEALTKELTSKGQSGGSYTSPCTNCDNGICKLHGGYDSEDEDMYKLKYLKYKAKYMKLKSKLMQ